MTLSGKGYRMNTVSITLHWSTLRLAELSSIYIALLTNPVEAVFDVGWAWCAGGNHTLSCLCRGFSMCLRFRPASEAALTAFLYFLYQYLIFSIFSIYQSL